MFSSIRSLLNLRAWKLWKKAVLVCQKFLKNVPRAKKIKLEYTNENGEIVALEAEGMFARAIQHEYDHLEGILFIDKIAKFRKIIIKRKLHELEKTTTENGENFRTYE